MSQEWQIGVKKLENILELSARDDESLNMLESFFETKEHLNYSLSFNYQKDDLLILKKS